MSSRGVRAGRAFVEVGGDDALLQRALRRAQARLRAFGTAVRNIGVRTTVLGAAITAPILAAAKSFASAGDTIDKMSKRTGVGIQALQELGFAAEQNGASLEVLEKGFAGLSRTFFDAMLGSSEAVDALDAIGLKFQDLQKLSPEQQFMRIAEALEAITNESIRGAAAQKIFGRAGRELLPMLRGSRGGIAHLRQQFAESGGAMSDEDVATAAALTDAMNLLRVSMKGLVNTIGAAVAPILIQANERLTRLLAAVNRFTDENRGAIVAALKVGTAIAAVGASLTVAGIGLLGMAKAIAIAMVAVKALTIALPIAGIIALTSRFVNLRAALQHVVQTSAPAIQFITGALARVWEFASEVFGGIGDAIRAEHLDLAARIAWLGVKVAVLQGVEELTGVFKSLFARIMELAKPVLARLKPISDGASSAFGDLMTGLRFQFGRELPEHARRRGRVISAPGETVFGERTTPSETFGPSAPSALERAIWDLQQAIQEAARARREAERPGFQMPEFGGIAEEVRRTIRARGVFGGAMAGMALNVGSGSVEEKQLRSLERMQRSLKRIEDASQNGLAFT